MKVLLISDFHGTLPEIKEKFDLIISPGDLPYSDELRDLEFKNWGSKLKIHQLISKKEYLRIYKKAANSYDKILQWMNDNAKRTALVYGNADFTRKSLKGVKYFTPEPLEEKVKKYPNIKLLKTNTLMHEGLQILGISGYRGFKTKFPKKNEKEKASKYNNKWNIRLTKLFSKKRKNTFTILLAHDPPKGIMDQINNKKSPINGKNIGDEYLLKHVIKNKPDLMICGHMHEYQGKKKLENTTVINPGHAQEGHYAIMEIENNKIKKLTFY